MLVVPGFSGKYGLSILPKKSFGLGALDAGCAGPRGQGRRGWEGGRPGPDDLPGFGPARATGHRRSPTGVAPLPVIQA